MGLPPNPSATNNDQWDIEFVSPSNLNACEASSLSSLTNEYEDAPDTSRRDDDTATNTNECGGFGGGGEEGVEASSKV
jgi:hypothetical protein